MDNVLVGDGRRFATQAEFGALVGIGQSAVSDLMRRNVIAAGDTAERWLLAYCGHLREVADKQIAAGSMELGAERAALAREQRERIALQNEQTRKELAPVDTLDSALSLIGVKVAAALAEIPRNARARCLSLTDDDLTFITVEVTKVQQIALTARLNDVDFQEGDEFEEANSGS